MSRRPPRARGGRPASTPAWLQALADAVHRRKWQLAHTPARRLLGWMGRRYIAPHEVMCLLPCSAVHTCFLRVPIDVVFLAADGTVLRRLDGLPPWRFARSSGASAVLELAAGGAARIGLVVGARLASLPPEDPAQTKWRDPA